MTLSIRQRAENGASGTGAISLTLSSAQVGDTVFVIHLDDFHTLAGLTVPTGTAVSSWDSALITVDGGSNDSHGKAWRGVVTTAGGTVVEGTANTDHERGFWAWVFVGSVDFDEAAFTEVDTQFTSHVVPSMDSDTADAWELCAWMTTTAVTNYTIPGSMTAGAEFDLGGFVTGRAGDEQITATGATGTRTATSSASQDYIAIGVLVKSGAPPPAAPDLFVVRSSLRLR